MFKDKFDQIEIAGLNFTVMHDVPYNVEAWITIDALKISLSRLLEEIKVVPSVKYQGNFTYIVPESFDIEEKDKSAKKVSTFECWAETCNSYYVNFHGIYKGKLYKIKLDYCAAICNERYSTLAKGNKIPYLELNPYWGPTSKVHVQYHGKNGASSGNYRYGKYYQYGSFKQYYIELNR